VTTLDEAVHAVMSEHLVTGRELALQLVMSLGLTGVRLVEEKTVDAVIREAAQGSFFRALGALGVSDEEITTAMRTELLVAGVWEHHQQ